MRKYLKALVCAAILAVTPLAVGAQTFALKSNLLYDAALSPNLGIEIRLAPKWTFDLSGNLNAWSVNKHSWKHWLVQPELRYWFCRTFSGHFVGAHLLGGQYNFGNLNTDFKFLGTDFGVFKDNRRQGWYGGVGIAYGYTWILSRYWSIEAELGVGYVYSRYDQYPCATCGTRTAHDKPHHYVGPTKAAVNLIYNF